MGAPWAGWRGGAWCFHGAVTSPPGMGQQPAAASSWPLGAAGDLGAALRGPCSGHQFCSPAQGPGSLALGPPALPPCSRPPTGRGHRASSPAPARQPRCRTRRRAGVSAPGLRVEPPAPGLSGRAAPPKRCLLRAFLLIPEATAAFVPQRWSPPHASLRVCPGRGEVCEELAVFSRLASRPQEPPSL